jgi:hypothetical protein
MLVLYQGKDPSWRGNLSAEYVLLEERSAPSPLLTKGLGVLRTCTLLQIILPTRLTSIIHTPSPCLPAGSHRSPMALHETITIMMLPFMHNSRAAASGAGVLYDGGIPDGMSLLFLRGHLGTGRGFVLAGTSVAV